MHERGTIKWTSLMMPEQIQMLHELGFKLNHHVDKPILSEDKMHEMEQVISEAFQDKQPIEIQFYKNNVIQSVQGILKELKTESLLLMLDEYTPQRIYYTDLTNVEIV